MFLTNNALNSKICYVKTMVYKPFQVNEGNNKKPHSPVRSPSNSLNFIEFMNKGERENDFSRMYVRNYSLSLLILYFIYTLSTNLCFLFSRAHVFFYSPHSLLLKNNIKTNTYQVNDKVNDCFCRSPHSPDVQFVV